MIQSTLLYSLSWSRISILVTILLFMGQTLHASNDKQFVPWEKQVFAEVEKLHGKAAAKRLRKVHDFIIKNQGKPVSEILELVNDKLNALPWIADPDLWKKEDYWATPFETLTTFGGDCEDIAIAKYVVLRLMGIHDKKLGFAYVVTSESERHMVLIYKESADDGALILDNLHPDVLSAKQRRDLLAVYVFQNDGTFFLIEDNRRDDRTIKLQVKSTKLSKWTSAKQRAQENRKHYEQFNGGRPLIPDWVKAEAE